MLTLQNKKQYVYITNLLKLLINVNITLKHQQDLIHHHRDHHFAVIHF